jgi:L-amino acid N-acyltransferase YncA
MSFALRPASLADFDVITTIYRECVENGTATYELTAPTREEMARRFQTNTKRGYPYIVAEDAGQVIGYAYASPFRDRPAYRFLVEDSIYLASEARGKGAGRRLLDALEERCTELGFRQMVAVIGGAHPASVGVHRAAGFTMIGTMPGTGFKFGRWLDTVIMQKELGEGLATLPDEGSYPGTLFSA